MANPRMRQLLPVLFAVLLLAGCSNAERPDLNQSKPLTAAELFAVKCAEANQKVNEFEAENESALELKAINSLQKNEFLATVNRLFNSGKISNKDWKLVQSYAAYDFRNEYKEKTSKDGSSKVVGPPSSPNSLLNHLDDSLTLGNLFDAWIEMGLIKPYLFDFVIKRGNALATSVPKADQVILDNPECFSDSRVSLVKSISEFRKPGKSNWGKIKSGSELLTFLD